MNNCLFIIEFLNVACALQQCVQSQNNKKWPNKNNDVITDLGGGGNFPMFLCGFRILSAIPTLLLARAQQPFPKCPECRRNAQIWVRA